MRRPLAIAATLVAPLSLLIACGDDDTTAETAASTTTAAPDAPDAIVSISPTATEMLFAIGAGDQVVAVDDYSTYPEEAPITDLSALDPNLEAIADYEPDLVVTSDVDSDLEAGLEQLGIDVLSLPAATTLDDTYEQLEQLGTVTGHAEEAAELVAEMQAEIEELIAGLPERDEPLTYFHELDSTLFSVTSATFIGELYALAGLENVADPADADGQSAGYPQLSSEFLVEADPDLVFLADTTCCQQTAETFAARPGFAAMQAVTEGNVVLLDDDIASRWGPRVVDLLRTIIDAVKAVPAS